MTQPFETYIRKGKVIRVVDADTLDILVDLGYRTYTVQRIRLARIDAPERLTPEGIEATEFVREQFAMVPDVTIQTVKNPEGSERDRGRRYVAEVWLDTGQNLGDLMLTNGHAILMEAGESGR